jgi:amino acid adenylation domain-containing protein
MSTSLTNYSPLDEFIPSLFSMIAQERTDANALFFQGQTMSYEKLENLSNRLAHALLLQGVQPEMIIGVYLPVGFERIIALLAILKLGAGYLPIDTWYPSARVNHLLSDSQAKFVLSSAQIASQLPANSTRVILIDGFQHSQSNYPLPKITLYPDLLAYMIYTSGSTGQPKGVLVSHAGLVNMVKNQITAFEINEKSRVLQFASNSFDASISEIFTTLLAGGTLYLADRDEINLDEGLQGYLAGNQISVLTLPPSILRLESLNPQELPALKTIVSAGEACGKEIIEKWGNTRLFINAYGPTETTVCASLAICQPDQPITLGKALSGIDMWLLDEQLAAVAPGKSGEIYIGGKGLARGYHHMPALTASVFIPHPYSKEAGARLYRTGDVARRMENGEFYFEGREDNLVKIRGHRIELGEVEHALRNYPLIEDAIAVVEDDIHGNFRIIAYIKLKNGATFQVSKVRSELQDHLPYFMVPWFYVLLDQFPLTSSGKIDRQALPAPNLVRPHLNVEYTKPASDTEERILEIWQEILGVKEIGVLDNFFDLGGHSLIATQVISRIRTTFDIELPITRLFLVEPNIRNSAEIVESILQEKSLDDEFSDLLDELAQLSEVDIASLFETAN